jgi:hydroxymethylbilane synthase
MTRIRIGTRGSALALWQAREVARQLGAVAPDAVVELVEITSTGDTVTDVPLQHVEGTGFFTASIERALAAGEVDVAVHSHKDLPVDTTPGLVVAAVPERGPIEDVLCASGGLTLATLPAGARVGTCSLRRTAQVLARRPDLAIHVLRGNVPTRVGRLASGSLDAVVLARAGLVRLGLDGHITETFSTDGFLPAPAQGALAIQCRAADTDLRARIGRLDHLATRRAVEAERAVLHTLGGGCSVPVGAVAVDDGREIALRAGVFSVDGTHQVLADGRGVDPAALGAAVARQLLDLGAGALLDAAGHPTRHTWSSPAEIRP